MTSSLKRKENPSGSNESLTVKKKRQRLQLALEIEEMGVEMEPCAYCAGEERRCIFLSERSDRCSECVRMKKSSCDAKLPLGATWDSEVPKMSDWESLDRQVERLDDEEEVAAQAAATAMAKQQEAMAKIMRLRKQKAFLKDRRKTMVLRGLRYLSELDALEEKEKSEQKEAGHNELCSVNLAGSGEGLDLGGPSSDLPPLSQQEWQAMMDFADETPSVSQSS